MCDIIKLGHANMNDLINFHPYYYNFEYARQFIMPKKKDTSLYEPYNPDYGSILTSLFKNTASFAVRGPQAHFNHVPYLTHFFLALLFTSHEKNMERMGIKNSFWRVDPKTKNVEMFIVCEKNGKKSLILKTVNFNNVQKHQWSSDSLKSIVSYLNDVEEDAAKFSIESHWYDVKVENIPSDESIAVPFMFFMLDVKEDMEMDAKLVRDGSKMKRKFRTMFQKISGGIPKPESIVSNLRSNDENKVKNGFNKLLELLVKVHKQNFYGSLVEELKSYRSDSQCGFAHGMMLYFQNKLSIKVDIEQTFTLEDPGYRIKITKNLKKSFNELSQEFPLQIDFLPNVENAPSDGIDRSIIYGTGPKIGDAEEMPFNTLNVRYIFSYLNLKVDKDNYRVTKGLTMAPVESIFHVARKEAIITLKDPIVEKLDTLKTFIDFEFMYILQVYKSHYKEAHLNYLSRYVHGYLTSDPVSREGSAFVIEQPEPQDFDGKYMKSFMIKTYDNTIDFIVNIYEKQEMSNAEIINIEKLSRNRQYPKSSNIVKHSIILDYCVSFSLVSRPEHRSLVLTSTKAFMKSVAAESSNNGWQIERIQPLDIISEMENFRGRGTREENLVDRTVLKKVKTIFGENFHYISSHNEMKAVLEGILHDTRTLSNIVYFRKKAHQVAFLDKSKQLCIINFAYGSDGFSAMADVQDFFESKMISGFDNVKTFNLAVFKDQPLEPRSRIAALPNIILSMLSRCAKPRMKRSDSCLNKDIQELSPFVDKPALELKPAKKNYLESTGKVASGIMYGLMGKDFISDLIRGDYVGMSINAGFLLSNVLTNSLAEKLLSKASALTMRDKRLMASVLRASSPFLRRCPSFAFVGFDLYNSIKAYKNYDLDAVVNIGTDSTYIAIDLAETAIEISEAYGILEEVSAVTGPIGWTLGATLLVGGEIYRSVRAVERIDDVVHLTWTEKFTEGVRSFFGMDPENHVKKLMSEKHDLEATISLMTSFLRQHQFIKSYVFPLPLNVMSINVTKIDLRVQSNMKITRAVPSLPQEFQYFCMPSLVDGYFASGNMHARYCHNAIGLQKVEKSELNITYVQIPHGASEVYGMEQEINVFDVIGGGSKTVVGGISNDVYIIRSRDIQGSLFGGLGDNVLDFSAMKDDIELEIFDYFTLFGGEHFFFHNNMTSIVGRNNFTDRIIAWCSLKNVALLGGSNASENGHDFILIHEINCEYNLTIIMNGYSTKVVNRAFRGHFTYAISEMQASFHIYIWHKILGTHNLIFDYAAYEISNITTESIDSLVNLYISLKTNITGLVQFPRHCQKCNIFFKDGVLQQLTNGEYILNVTSDASIDDLAELYENFVTKFDISVIIHSLSEKKSATLNKHTARTNVSGIYSADVVYSDSHDQVFESNAHELIYIVRKIKNKPIHKTLIVNATIHQKVIVDFRAIARETGHLSFNAFGQEDDIILQMIPSLSTNDVEDPSVIITIVNAMKHKSFQNIFVRGKTTMLFSIERNLVKLSPLPLEFDNEKNLVVISPEDDLEYETIVKFNRTLDKYDCFHMNKQHLLVTNILLVHNESHYFTLILIDFFRSDIIKSLKLAFKNETTDLTKSNCLLGLQSMDYFSKRLLYKQYSSNE